MSIISVNYQGNSTKTDMLITHNKNIYYNVDKQMAQIRIEKQKKQSNLEE